MPAGPGPCKGSTENGGTALLKGAKDRLFLLLAPIPRGSRALWGRAGEPVGAATVEKRSRFCTLGWSVHEIKHPNWNRLPLRPGVKFHTVLTTIKELSSIYI